MRSNFLNLSITTRVGAAVLGAAVTLAVAIGVSNYLQVSSNVRAALNERLSAIAESRRDALSDYLTSIGQDARTLATNANTLAALRDFETGWRTLPGDPQPVLQRLYIQDNPNPTGQKDNLDDAGDGSAYSRAHRAHHPWFRQFLNERGYYDIFLFSLDGDLVYTVFKEADYATNLETGQYRDTDLGGAFRAAARTLRQGELAFFDFAPYAPSHDAPASFVATPIFDETGARAGVLALQMPIGRMNDALSSAAGLGETGESFLIGADGLLRTDARTAATSTILTANVGPAVRAAVSDAEGSVVSEPGWHGRPALAAVAPFNFEGVQWAVVSQMDRREAFAPLAALRNQMVLISVMLLAALGVAGVWVARQISGPIVALSGATRRIAEGDRESAVPAQKRGDEIGQLADAIESFRVKIIAAERAEAARRDAEEERRREAEQQRAEAEERAKRGERIAEETARFESLARETIGAIVVATQDLETSAATMAAIAEETSNQSNTVASASRQTAGNVQSVAAATEEMTVTANDISTKMSNCAEITKSAVARAEQIRHQVDELESVSGAISEVVNLITSIASQTNLLALNATIEAARAGEAGKGFAVVAGEVKELASQTSAATARIEDQIGAIQSTARVSAEAIREIASAIETIDATTGDVAASVCQQASVATEISDSIQQAAMGVQEVDNGIAGVGQASGEAGQAATAVSNAINHVSRQSDDLQSAVERFLDEVRSA